ncbi:hypothetical protein HQN64_00590 [Enterobacteriaceae bacterium BIT-l23]|uniref:GDA1/CD39 family protein n=1 Tax=Jejubacter calystegiae TaxID=2579935 RepID=A0A4P8YHJ9_9ENTR|nr:hypothetical protein [Jejubacter calystegiae]NUU64609.1 hypothetical protein [Enterobacteriaceae bacterium BIT-l23]QCT20111.1 hypothetical protein FEM41_10850 [Jejubacter calystegiae]
MHKSCIKYVPLLMLMLFITVKNNVYAATPEYSVVVDAGSSKTRAILYQVSDSDSVKEVASETQKTPLASFSQSPENAGKELIAPLLKKVLNSYNNKPQTIDINVLGTAGMRQLTADMQEKIYRSIQQTVKDEGYRQGRIGTIDGWEEGAFAWVHLNQLAGLTGTDNTQGIIEVGGASTQITFDSKNASLSGTHPLKLKGKTYYLWSRSLLGFGANSIRDEVDKKEGKKACYPQGYQNSKGFDFNQCDQGYDNALAENPEALSILKATAGIPALKTTQFVGLSALNYTLGFFDTPTAEKGQLKENITTSCTSFSDINNQIKNNPTKDSYQPENKCANGTFVYNLLYDYLKLGDKKITGVKNYNGSDIRWTAGYLILAHENQNK